MAESKYVNAFEAIDAVLTKLGYVNNKAGESMSKPKRIQRKRKKGWRMPENAVYVGRPTILGNPNRVVKTNRFPDCGGGWSIVNEKHEVISPEYGEKHTALKECVELYQRHLLHLWDNERVNHSIAFVSAVDELRGKDLACWCSLDQPCHADVLLELANS